MKIPKGLCNHTAYQVLVQEFVIWTQKILIIKEKNISKGEKEVKA